MTDEERARELLDAAIEPDREVDLLTDDVPPLVLESEALQAITAALRIPAQGVGVREVLSAARILLEACSTEFGDQPDAPDDATVTGDPDCEIRWRHIRRLTDAFLAISAPSPSPERATLERAAKVADKHAERARSFVARCAPWSQAQAEWSRARDLGLDIAEEVRALIPPLPEQPDQGER